MPFLFVLVGLLMAFSPAPVAAADSPRFVMDGRFEDWDGVGPSQKVAGVGAMKAAALPGALYLYFDLDRVRNLDRLDAPLRIAIDADGSTQTGWPELGLEGVDAVLEIPASAGIGAAVRHSPAGPGADVALAGDAGLLLAPTYASKQFELRLSAPAVKSGGHVALAAAFGDAPPASAAKLTVDVGDAGSPEEVVNPFARPAGTDFRVVLWNVYKLRLRQRPDGFVRVLRALDPDIILLSEVAVNASEHELDELFKRLAEHDKWDLVLGTSGQMQRSIVAGRKDTDAVDGFGLIEYPAAGREAALEGDLGAQEETRVRRLIDGGVSATAADTKADDEHLLAIVADLTCCGRAGGREDRIRQAEADAINARARLLLRGEHFRGVVIGGDLNLVASRKPLDDLRRALDLGGDDLAVAQPLSVDGGANYTWRQPGALFPPGRLDYVVYSRSTLEVVRALVVETEKLDERTRRRFAVEASDTDADISSDHLPVVVDFTFKRD